jgi:DNA-binding transcriptional LysR family regulator
LRAEVGSPTRLLDRVQDGSLDLAVLYNPPQRPELVAELLAEEKLILVTSADDGTLDPEHYIYVDWGEGFAANHQAAFPELGSPRVSISHGPLALNYLLSVGGSGYFRVSAARPFLAEGRLQRVAQAPEFSHSIYTVYSTRRDDRLVNRVRGGLRTVAAGLDKPRTDKHGWLGT